MIGLDGRYDLVHAEFDGGDNVPRIPPQRLGGGIWWADDAWWARVGILHAFDQTRISINETSTDGYDMLEADHRLHQRRRADLRVAEVLSHHAWLA